MSARIFLTLLAAAVAVALIVSERPWNMTSAPRLAEVAVLPDTPAFADVRRYTEIGSGMLPYAGGAAPPSGQARPPLRLGWTYREVSALRLPFWASDEYGFVTYLEQPAGIQFGMLSRSHIAMIEQRLGRRVAQDYRFPWYLHLWGWLPLVGLVVWTWLWRREANIAEEARWAGEG
jgi:hypothetical protein